jgi:hypothetical protein
MRVSHSPLFVAAFILLVCSAPFGVQAQPVEYGASAVAGVETAAIPDGFNADVNLAGISAFSYAELVDVTAVARVGTDRVSGLSEVVNVADSDALTYDTYFWDTFTVTSASLSNGTPTTVTLSLGLDAVLTASSNDPLIADADVVALMIVGVYDATLTNDVPTETADLFVGTAYLDAVSGLSPEDDLIGAPFSVEAVSGGYTATLTEFVIDDINIATTVGSEFSLKFSVETGASVAPGLTDGIARADLRNSLRILAIETEEGVELRRSSGALIPPVPLHVTPVLLTVLPGLGLARLTRRSNTAA